MFTESTNILTATQTLIVGLAIPNITVNIDNLKTITPEDLPNIAIYLISDKQVSTYTGVGHQRVANILVNIIMSFTDSSLTGTITPIAELVGNILMKSRTLNCPHVIRIDEFNLTVDVSKMEENFAEAKLDFLAFYETK